MAELIYSKLSYRVIGLLYDVYNELQYGHKEKIYQKALSELLIQSQLNFERELYFPVDFKGKIISCYYFDFLIENKIVLEMKVANNFYQKDINQLLSYLKYKGYKLGILAIFTKEGLKYRRFVN